MKDRNVSYAVKWPHCRHSSKRRSMRAFDALPPEMRKALAEAEENYCPACILRYFKQGGRVAFAMAQLKAWDREYIARYRACSADRSNWSYGE